MEAIGELRWLDELAAYYARDGLFEFMFTGKPVNFDGFRSPANAFGSKIETRTNRRML
jgi:hypothetical protein